MYIFKNLILTVFMVVSVFGSWTSFADENAFSFLGVYSGFRSDSPKKKAVLDFDIEESNQGKGLLRIKFIVQGDPEKMMLPGLGQPKFYALISLDDYKMIFENPISGDPFDTGWYQVNNLTENSNWQRIQNFPNPAHYRVRAFGRGTRRRVEIFYRLGQEKAEVERNPLNPQSLILDLKKEHEGWRIDRITMNQFIPKFRFSNWIDSIRAWLVLRSKFETVGFQKTVQGIGVVESMFGRITGDRIYSDKKIGQIIGTCSSDLKTFLSY